ncbi:riboflavin biosynthesis protein RibF [bacterium]|nr:riboflavin biosynthesis protein RibF [bacterium]MBU1025377.1 riboflavin biosynthesis protein RibF [bacterium]
MKIFQSIDDFISPPSGIVIMIGKTDSLHLGHIALINETIGLGLELNCETGILSLIPDFSNPIFMDQSKFILTIDERKSFLQNWPIGQLIYQNMTPEFTSQSARDFITNILIEKFHVRGIVVGWDFVFGRGRDGDVDLLKTAGDKYGFTVKVIEPVTYHDLPIKTTLIRELILDGDFMNAQHLLGYPYFISGTVVTGKGLGKGLGFPTANIDVPEEKLLPRFGVHIVRALFDNQVFWGLANVGIRPTIEDDNSVVTEVWLKDYSGDLVGKEIKIEFFKFLRDEIKFPSLDELKIQMKDDSAELDEYLSQM